MKNNYLSGLISLMSDVAINCANKIRYYENINAMLYELGWNYRLEEEDIKIINHELGLLKLIDNAIDKLYDIDSSDNQSILSISEKIITLIPELISTLNSLDNLSISRLPKPFSEEEFIQQLKEEFLSYIICSYLDRNFNTLLLILYSIGIVNAERQTPTGTNRTEYTRYEVAWDGLLDFITDPIKYIASSYNWGSSTNAFDYTKFFYVVNWLCSKVSINLFPYPAYKELKDIYYNPDNAAYDKLPMLEFPFVLDDDFNNIVGFHLMPIPAVGDRDGVPVGFNIAPFLKGSADVEIHISDYLKLYLSGGFSADSPFRFEIRPSGTNLVIDKGASLISGKIGLAYKPESPIYLLGSKESKTFLNIEGLYGAIGIKEVPGSEPEFIFEFGTSENDTVGSPQLNLTIDLSEGDGFISKIFKNTKPITNNIVGKFIYSSKNGLSFCGQAGLKIKFALNKKLGPIDLNDLVIGLSIGKDPGIYAGLNAGVNISALHAEVSEIGLSVKLKDTTGTGKKGIFGNYDLELGFKPPNGVGLRIEASVVKGGGFLSLDYDAGKYSGALDLKLSKLSLAALGLLCTKLPGGRKGFSLLVIISVSFGSGIPLIFGFKLTKVGGLLGLNRVMEGDNIRKGVRDGSMTKVLFPEEPTKHAMEILSSLESYFPISEKETFIIGPMLQLGWGTPVLITIDLMVLIQINPLVIGIAGLLRCMLPTTESAILRLNVAFFGELNPPKKFLKFDAAIFDSGILFLSISGGMAVRLFWGGHGGFLISVGGFHPNYVIPPEMELTTAPDRLKITIIDKSFIKINLDAYFAVTSNTVQFGTHLNLYVNVASIIEVKGYLGFDALIYFKPKFSFVTNIGLLVSVSIFGEELLGISLFFNLSGPKPWHAWGSGSFKLLFIKYSTNFDHTFGEQIEEAHEKILVFPLFKEELEKKKVETGKRINWEIVEASTTGLEVRLRQIGSEEMILSPTSSLKISQRIVPMGVTIDKFGTKDVDGQNKFDISDLKLYFDDREDPETTKIEETRDQFAPGEFFNLSTSNDIGKKSQSFLKSPSFKEFKSGIIIHPQNVEETLDFEYVRRKVLTSQLIMIDSTIPIPPENSQEESRFESSYHYEKSLFGNTASQSTLSPYTNGSRPFTPATTVKTVSSAYAVVSTTDHELYDANASYPTQTEADQSLKDLISESKVKQGEYMAINLCELN